MKKRILMITSGIICLLLFSAGIYEMFIVPEGAAFSETENRMLNEKPLFTLKSFLEGTFSNDYESYLLDHFPFRDILISMSKEVRQIGSLSTFDDYAKVMEIEAEDVQNNEAGPDDFVVTPRPTKTPEPVLEETIAPVYENTEETTINTDNPANTDITSYTPLPTDTPAPTASPRPTKVPAELSDFPTSLCFYSLFDGGRQRNFYHSRSEVYRQCSLFDSYASLLPEDGIFAMTIVPNSLRASRLLSRNNPEGLTSEIEPFIHAMTCDKVFAFSTADMLSQPLLSGEYVYFRSDMHWTPRGAYYAVSKMMEIAGENLPDYEDFPCKQEYPFLGTIYRDKQSKELAENPDTLDIITPSHTVKVLRYSDMDTYSEIPLIKEDANPRDRYTVYLGGSAGPWTEIINQDGNGRNCLLITDSYGLCAIPMFSEVYSKVCYYDPRYYSLKDMGSVSELIEKNNVTDIFMIVGELHAFDDSFFIFCNRHF